MRKHRGTVWIALGLLLLLGAGGLTFYNLEEEASAGRESEAVLEKLVYELHGTSQGRAAKYSPDSEELVLAELDGRSYMGIVTIPALGLQLPVQNEWSYPNLKISPCRMTGSAETEDLVILAHNYRTHFGKLDQLSAGDEVTVTLLDGTTYRYQVDTKEVVLPTAVEDVTSGEWPLTLFTCTTGGRTRVVVRCDLVQE